MSQIAYSIDPQTPQKIFITQSPLSPFIIKDTIYSACSWDYFKAFPNMQEGQPETSQGHYRKECLWLAQKWSIASAKNNFMDINYYNAFLRWVYTKYEKKLN